MKKFTPNQGQKEVLSVLAHCLIAAEIDRNVEGYSGFFDHYIKEALDDRQRGIWNALKADIKKYKGDMVALMEKTP